MVEPTQPARPRMSLTRRIAGILAAALAVFLVVAGVYYLAHRDRGDHRAPDPAPASGRPASGKASMKPASATPAPSWTRGGPALPDDVTALWAYLDSTDGTHTRTGGEQLHPIDRLIVPGAAAVLADQSGDDLGPGNEAVIARALAQDPDAGDQVVRRAGGAEQAFAKVIDACQLDDAETGPARATMLAVARYAACLREGAIAAPDRTGWLLDQMRNVAGGIGDVRGTEGGQRLAQFNSTVPAGNNRSRTWCIGVGPYWSAAVQVEWGNERGSMYGVAACAEVARASFPPDTQQAPESLSPTPAASA